MVQRLDVFPSCVIAFAILLSCLINGVATGQEKAQGNSSTPARGEISWQDQLQLQVSIEMPSGSVGEFVELVRQSNPKLNIVVTGPASSLNLPEIKLVDVPVRGALTLLNSLTNDEVSVNIQSVDDGAEANLVLISGGNQLADQGSNTVRVLNVKRLLQSSTKADLLAAMDEAYRMMGNQTTPIEIKIHEATGLLFVKGTPGQLELAESIVTEMQRGLGAWPIPDQYGNVPSSSPGPVILPSADPTGNAPNTQQVK